MSRELNRLITLILLAFGAVSLGASYWSLVGRESLFAREDNPRRVLAELNVQRGQLVDRTGVVLAYSQPAENPAFGARRIYPYPQAVSALGHYSYQYGVAGIEEGYNAFLNGDGLPNVATQLSDDLLNRSRTGGDVRTTLDIDLQTRLYEAMQGQRGAALVVEVPSGAVLGMVSLPAYDPNQMAVIGPILKDNPENTRVLNRVTDGVYQPGGALQTLLLSAMLAAGLPLDTTTTLESVMLDQPSLALTCALSTDLVAYSTLAEGYLHGCPAPFLAALGDVLTPQAADNTLQAAGLGGVPPLGGFIMDTSEGATPLLTEDSLALQADIAGQGKLTVSPLQMIQVISAVVNGGNGVPVHLVEATRYPADADWQAVEVSSNTLALMQPAIAQTIQSLLMTRPWADDAPIFGHLSVAYAADREYAWFLGWTPLADGSEAVMVVVLEGKVGELDLQQAAHLAVEVLR